MLFPSSIGPDVCCRIIPHKTSTRKSVYNPHVYTHAQSIPIMAAFLLLIVICGLGAASGFPHAPKPHDGIQYESRLPDKKGFSKEVEYEEETNPRDNADEFELKIAAKRPRPIKGKGPSSIELEYLENRKANEDTEGATEFEMNSAALFPASEISDVQKPHDGIQYDIPHKKGFSNEVEYEEETNPRDNADEFELKIAAKRPRPIKGKGPSSIELEYLENRKANEDTEGATEFEMNSAALFPASEISDVPGPITEIEDGNFGNVNSEGEYLQVDETYAGDNEISE